MAGLEAAGWTKFADVCPTLFLHVVWFLLKPIEKEPQKKGQDMHDCILRRPDVEVRTGLARSTLYAMIAEGTFPKPLKLGKRAVGWRESEITAWIDNRSVATA